MHNSTYQCPKCRNNQYEVAEFRATGGIWTKLFNIQTERFTTVTCSRCRFTEMYKADQSTLGNILDFFTN